MTKARKARVLLACEGRCRACSEKIVGAFDVDHVIPLELGGADADENLQALHPGCHAAKTKADKGSIAKARRRRRKAPFVARPPSKLKGRGFSKGKRPMPSTKGPSPRPPKSTAMPDHPRPEPKAVKGLNPGRGLQLGPTRPKPGSLLKGALREAAKTNAPKPRKRTRT